ncbi:hypothetical protein [Peptostreptococcus porci]|uniref:hypothetical protein n=1 Tax=Peptostreptococcus porci TaxID=2652282 RepID=UPI002A759C0E|nr:hypothetical protein [Peptostreptococcus porci]MDY2794792.1 hypothetical protein [Peptostreptococcus porci]
MEEEKLLKMNLQLLAGEDDSEDNTDDDVDNNDVGDNSDDKIKSEKKYSDDDVDRIIEKKLEKWKKQQQKEIDEAKKLGKITRLDFIAIKKKINEKIQDLEELNLVENDSVDVPVEKITRELMDQYIEAVLLEGNEVKEIKWKIMLKR